MLIKENIGEILSFSGFNVSLHSIWKNSTMKKDLHPKNYRMVVFKDISCDYSFMSRSTVETKDSVVWEDGKEYPLIKLEISHMSHPFYTGKMKLVDTAGRVDKFRNRYKKHTEKSEKAGVSEDSENTENKEN